MKYKVLVNSLTISRFILSIIFAYYIITDMNFILVTVLFTMICITDLLDGKLARRFAVTSSFGAYLDVIADLFYMLSAGISLFIIQSYPSWMLLVIIVKFIEFWYTSSIIRRCRSNGKQIFMSDYLGRRVAAIYYVLPYIIILSDFCLTKKVSFLAINIICIIIALGAFVSSMQRIKCCIMSCTLHNVISPTNGRYRRI